MIRAVLLPEGYTELGVLDDGPSGPVTVARPPRGGSPVAVVLLPSPNDPALAGRLVQLRGLRHRSIAAVIDWVETADGILLIGELVDAVPLRALLDSTGLLPVEAALVVLRDSLLAAATANDAGLPRGDHRPETVVLTRRGEVRLLEVGLTTVASAPYLAPEVWEGGPATPASDVYAATAVLVECLGGGPPYGAVEDLGELRNRHLRAPVPVERVPEALRGLVRHGLDKDPRERCAEARLLLLELAAVAGGTLGSGWERRGREQLAAAVRPLEFLFPPPRLLGSGAAGAGAAAVPAEARRDRRRAAAAIGIAAALLVLIGGTMALRHRDASAPSAPVTGIGTGQGSDLAPLVIPGATSTPIPSPTAAPTPQPTPSPGPSATPSALPTPAPAPTSFPTPTPRLLPVTPTPSAAPSPTPTPTPAPMTATGVRKLAFQHCTPGTGGFVCPFTVTFDWNDPGGTGGSIAWHLGGSVVSQTTGCTTPVPFSVAETTTVPQEPAGAHSATISGSLTVSADPAGPAAPKPSTATASLDAGGASAGPAPFYGGSTC
jgi:serine/threonine-protein kinase